jgi:hypothetical protein
MFKLRVNSWAMLMATLEQQARDLLEQIGIEGAQTFLAGELVKLSNLIGKSQEYDRLLHVLDLLPARWSGMEFSASALAMDLNDLLESCKISKVAIKTHIKEFIQDELIQDEQPIKDERTITISGTYYICGHCRNGFDGPKRANSLQPPEGISHEAWAAAFNIIDRACLINETALVTSIAKEFQKELHSLA